MNKRGFTLIELVVVVAIIALLSTLAIVSLQEARGKQSVGAGCTTSLNGKCLD